MQNYSDNNSIFIVCGETSADEHMAPVVALIKSQNPNIKFFGMGGHELESQGMDIIVDSRTTASVMGITEVVSKLGTIYKAFWKLVSEVEKRKPKVAVLVDMPDFNLRMAEKLHARGVKVVYFISPQLWAWRKGRINIIKKYVHKILPIFPFEEEFYRKEGVVAKYVGHPFVDRGPLNISRDEFFKTINLDSKDKQVIALLPGSRKAEIEKLLPVMAEVANRLKEENKDLLFVVPIAQSVIKIVNDIKNDPLYRNINFIEGRSRELLEYSYAGIVASGTATVEAAIARLPFCICYKVSKLTYVIGKLLIKGVSFIGMPNLIAGRMILKEFIQDQASADNLYSELKKIIIDQDYRNQILSDLDEVKQKLQTDKKETVSVTVAREILNTLDEDESKIERRAA